MGDDVSRIALMFLMLLGGGVVLPTSILVTVVLGQLLSHHFLNIDHYFSPFVIIAILRFQ